MLLNVPGLKNNVNNLNLSFLYVKRLLILIQ